MRKRFLKDFVQKSQEEAKIVYVYTIYDKAANYCFPPMATPSEPGRALVECQRQAMSGYIQYPGDKQLLLIGFFNDVTAELKPCDPQLVGDLKLPKDFKRSEEKGEENDEVSK